MANRSRKCAKCSYITNSAAAMQRHWDGTGHHKEPKKVAYQAIAGTKYSRKIRNK